MNRTSKHVVVAAASWCALFGCFATMRPAPTRVGDVVNARIASVTLESPPPTARSSQPPEDKILSRSVIEGRFVGFEVGDYVHAVIRDRSGQEHNLFVWSEGLSYFLASRQGMTLRFEYEEVDAYFRESNGVERIERLIRAST